MGIKPKISDLQQLGSNIRRVRTDKGISRAQLAFEIGTSEKHLSRIELGEVNSGILTFIKIARTLNVSLSDIAYKIKF
ncbi:MAG: helix-turn-helix domain-containing protein [Bacteroidota bacterium]|nr:helix-turn-helix domain-containing protein [Bacteroidota bacterium]